jgi:dihydrodipicolinate synthase/N-acetylneuraminate lyase
MIIDPHAEAIEHLAAMAGQMEDDIKWRVTISTDERRNLIRRARQIVEAGKLALYAGNDDLVLPFALLGGSGGICVASHIVGTEMTAVQAAADAGDADEATRLDDALQSAYTALSCAVNPIPVKTAMELLGFNVGDLRLPLVNATDEERAVVRAELVARGLIS